MAKEKKAPFFIKVCGDSRVVTLNTVNLFGMDRDIVDSPIDVYIKKNKSLLVKLGRLEREGLLDSTNEEDRDVYNLFLLGFISNVESFIRRIIRETILLDNIAYEQCLEQQLTYAAAIHHKVDLLPEALLENCTFISLDNIQKTTKTYLDININKQSSDQKELIECLSMFEQLCQLRHCIVHRAGLLGSKNAVKLGINQHSKFFEKPIVLDFSFLQESSAICLNCVRTYNNFLFNELLKRYVLTNKSALSWNFNSDRKWFSRYFKLFVSCELNNEILRQQKQPYTPKTAYNELRDYYEGA
ncbi:TPA: hypothetical protein ACU9NN_001189 [Enterobacter asburiae]|uniref:hypothetical protein n=1 Tax=Enterobacter kobei TaxID=208224 RepID=UPI0020048255|nr:hypothetical protein [Enterobacter kobei]MCK7086028.1 hypothetical protein [Enterobacter kobei]